MKSKPLNKSRFIKSFNKISSAKFSTQSQHPSVIHPVNCTKRMNNTKPGQDTEYVPKRCLDNTSSSRSFTILGDIIDTYTIAINLNRESRT